MWGFGARNVEPSGLVAWMVGIFIMYLIMFISLIKLHLDKLGNLMSCMRDIIDFIFFCECANCIPLILAELCSVVREPVNFNDPDSLLTLTHV
jgi:hypothetical protein